MYQEMGATAGTTTKSCRTGNRTAAVVFVAVGGGDRDSWELNHDHGDCW